MLADHESRKLRIEKRMDIGKRRKKSGAVVEGEQERNWRKRLQWVRGFSLLSPQALLVHVGDEHSVDIAYIDNTLGNPLHLRKYVSRLYPCNMDKLAYISH